MANRAVSLYISTKVGGKWTFRRAPKKPVNLIDGSFRMFWYDGGKKQSQNLGTDAGDARIAVARKESELRIAAAGGRVQYAETVRQAPDTQGRLLVRDAVREYLDECRDRSGRDGYGLAPRTLKVYQVRLRFLLEFDGVTPLNKVDLAYLKQFRRFLREHPSKPSDRYCHNMMQTICTLLKSHDNTVGAKVLKEMSFAPKACKPYTDDEMAKFFSACTPDEKLVFQFFLHSMGREQEVANTEVGDLDFSKNVLTICSKPHRGFRLKGKRGAAAQGRKVPLPITLMEKLKAHGEGKQAGDLLFANGQGTLERHFLRRCQAIAKRA